MKITDVQVRLNNSVSERVKADCRITLDDSLAIHGIKVIENNGKRYVSMPNKRLKENFVDIVHPTKSELREYIEQVIFEEYDRISAIQEVFTEKDGQEATEQTESTDGE